MRRGRMFKGMLILQWASAIPPPLERTSGAPHNQIRPKYGGVPSTLLSVALYCMDHSAARTIGLSAAAQISAAHPRRAAVPTTRALRVTTPHHRARPSRRTSTAEPHGASGRLESVATHQLAGRQMVHATVMVAALTRASANARRTTTQGQTPRCLFVALTLTQINRLCVSPKQTVRVSILGTSLCIMGTS